ncbi:MAG: hypothetical protein GYA34_07160 [Chloroflexi bacterium]|nr:hypothetical protein [Chloroflexota bacterium]
MFDIRINSFENRLYIALKGTIEQPEAAQGYNKLVKAMNSLAPGFSVITDIRELAPATADVRFIFVNMIQLLIKSQMAIEVRVVHPKDPAAAQIFERISRSLGYSAEEVHTVSEAERIIDKFFGA